MKVRPLSNTEQELLNSDRNMSAEEVLALYAGNDMVTNVRPISIEEINATVAKSEEVLVNGRRKELTVKKPKSYYKVRF